MYVRVVCETSFMLPVSLFHFFSACFFYCKLLYISYRKFSYLPSCIKVKHQRKHCLEEKIESVCETLFKNQREERGKKTTIRIRLAFSLFSVKLMDEGPNAKLLFQVWEKKDEDLEWQKTLSDISNQLQPCESLCVTLKAVYWWVFVSQ